MVKDKVGVEIEDQLLFAARWSMEERHTMDKPGVKAKSRVLIVSKKQWGRTRQKEPRQTRILPYTCKGTIVVGSKWEGGRKKKG